MSTHSRKPVPITHHSLFLWLSPIILTATNLFSAFRIRLFWNFYINERYKIYCVLVLDFFLINMFPGSIHITTHHMHTAYLCIHHVLIDIWDSCLSLAMMKGGAVNMHTLLLGVHMFSVILCIYQRVDFCTLWSFMVHKIYINIAILYHILSYLFYISRHQKF